MTLKLTVLSLITVFLCFFNAEAQKLKVTSGKLKDLSSYKSYNMVYTYEDGLKIGKKSEADYVAEKVVGKNEKEAGTGDTWAEKWHGNKEGGKFFEKFEELLNKELGNYGVSASRDNASASATMNVNVYYMDPGYNIGISRKPAYVSMTVTFVADGSELAVVDMVKAPGSGGSGYDFDASYRIGEGFAKSAKNLAKSMGKGAYK